MVTQLGTALLSEQCVCSYRLMMTWFRYSTKLLMGLQMRSHLANSPGLGTFLQIVSHSPDSTTSLVSTPPKFLCLGAL